MGGMVIVVLIGNLINMKMSPSGDIFFGWMGAGICYEKPVMISQVKSVGWVEERNPTPYKIE